MNVGLGEILVILIFAFLIIGPDGLPKISKNIGNAIRQFRDAQSKVNGVLNTTISSAPTNHKSVQNPFDTLANTADATPTNSNEENNSEKEVMSEVSTINISQVESQKVTSVRQVKNLSDIETFTQRKARLQSENEVDDSNSTAIATDTTMQDKED